jgi:hypothetical protein
MARPRKHNLDYFSHDNGMRNDPKIKAVRTRFGLKGYAIYNMLLETLSEANLLRLELNGTQLEIISGDFGISSEELIEMFDYFEKIKLIRRQNGYLFSPQLDRRAEPVFEKRTQLLEDLRLENKVNSTETPVSDAETPQSKVKESKVSIVHINQAKKLGELILRRKPDYKIVLKEKKKDYLKWAKVFRDIDELDNRDPKLTDILIEICQQDEFWQKNICSPGKLRVKYDYLTDHFAREINRRMRRIEEKESEARDRKRRLEEMKREEEELKNRKPMPKHIKKKWDKIQKEVEEKPEEIREKIKKDLKQNK